MGEPNYLADAGYDALALPKEKFAPLSLFMKRNGNIDEVGALKELILPGEEPLPEIGEGDVADLSGKLEKRTKASLAVSVLKLFAKLGGGDPAKVEAKFTNAREAEFSIHDPEELLISQIELAKYLQAGTPDESTGDFMVLLADDKIYAVWSVLRSSKVEVELEDSNGQSIGIEIPTLKELLGVGVEVSHSGESSSKVIVDGGQKMTFGFKAVQLFYENMQPGAFEPMDLDRMEPEERPLREAKFEEAVEVIE